MGTKIFTLTACYRKGNNIQTRVYKYKELKQLITQIEYLVSSFEDVTFFYREEIK